ncbi:MAG: hypothetical protein JWP34_1656 [Massilia sp.]|jgi:spore coat protein U-like protein|nr:hypothetical protein [Massilia sp.]
MFKLNLKLAAALVAAGMVSAAGLASAATATGNLVVSATLASGCEVQAGAISFGNITTLASTGDKVADSGTSFKVACSSDVVPTIASTTPRSMKDGAATPHLLPFNLSLTPGAAADDLPTSSPGTLAITQDGTLQTVTLHAKVLASNFSGANALPAGSYSNTMLVDVSY